MFRLTSQQADTNLSQTASSDVVSHLISEKVEDELLDRLQNASKEYQEVEEKLSRMTKLVHQAVPQEGDPIIEAALLAQDIEEGELVEAVLVSDGAPGVASEVVVVGEVVAAGSAAQ